MYMRPSPTESTAMTDFTSASSAADKLATYSREPDTPKRKPARGAMASPRAVTAYRPWDRATLASPRDTPSTTWEAKPMRPHSSEPARM